MDLGEPGQEHGGETPPEKFKARKADQCDPDPKENRNRDVAWPVRPGIDPGIGNQARWNEIQPAPPSVKYAKGRGGAEIIHRMSRRERVSSRFSELWAGHFNFGSFEEGQNPRAGIPQAHATHIGEHFVWPGSADKGFHGFCHDPVTDGNDQEHDNQRGPASKASEKEEAERYQG